MQTFLFSLLFICLFISDKTFSQENLLAGKKWVLTEIGKGETVNTGESGKIPFLIFKTDGKITGNTSCNLISGTYKQTGSNKIKFNAVTTKMMCKFANVEAGFMSAVDKADNYIIDGSILILKYGNKTTAKFSGQPLETTFENTKWKLTELVGKPVIPAGGFGEYFITFSDDLKANAKICNTIIGNYTKSGENSVKIELKVSTMMACPDLETEMIFKDAVNLADTYTIKDNMLTLSNGKVALAVFEVSK